MKKKYVLVFVALLFLSIVFFTYSPAITYDSSHYLYLSNMLNKGVPMESWDIGRGISFPLTIFILVKIFGNGPNALLVGMFVAYVLMLIFAYIIYKDTIGKKDISSKRYRVINIIAFVLLVVINPLIFGYYHTLLTEFVAMTISVIMSYVSWKWIDMDYKTTKKKYILTSMLFVVVTVYAWHIKQPYVTCVMLPLVISSFLSIMRNKTRYNVLSKLFTVFLCCIFLIVSIVVWNKALSMANVAKDSNRTSGGMISKMLTEGIANYNREFHEEAYTRESILVNKNIKSEDKEIILEILDGKSEKYKSFILFRKANSDDKTLMVRFLEDESLTLKESLKFVLGTLVKRPVFVIDGYVSGYLATIDVYKTEFELDVNKIMVVKKVSLLQDTENTAIAHSIYRTNTSNLLGWSPFFETSAKSFEKENKPLLIVNWYMQKAHDPSVVIFKVVFLLLPILLITMIIKYVGKKTKKIFSQTYIKIQQLIIILYSYSFLHILFHVVLGSNIDRYAVPAFITTIIGMMLQVYLIVYKNKLKRNDLLNGGSNE